MFGSAGAADASEGAEVMAAAATGDVAAVVLLGWTLFTTMPPRAVEVSEALAAE